MDRFEIVMGVPHMGKYWDELTKKQASNRLSKSEQKDFKKLIKAFKLLEVNPQYPGLQSHEIDPLTRRYLWFKGLSVLSGKQETRRRSALLGVRPRQRSDHNHRS